MGIPIINLRWSDDRLRLIMGIPIPVSWCLVALERGQSLICRPHTSGIRMPADILAPTVTGPTQAQNWLQCYKSFLRNLFDYKWFEMTVVVYTTSPGMAERSRGASNVNMIDALVWDNIHYDRSASGLDNKWFGAELTKGCLQIIRIYYANMLHWVDRSEKVTPTCPWTKWQKFHKSIFVEGVVFTKREGQYWFWWLPW